MKFGRLEIRWNPQSVKQRSVRELAVYSVWDDDYALLVEDGNVINGAWPVEYAAGGLVVIPKHDKSLRAYLVGVVPEKLHKGDYNYILRAFEQWHQKLGYWQKFKLRHKPPKDHPVPVRTEQAWDDDDIPF